MNTLKDRGCVTVRRYWYAIYVRSRHEKKVAGMLNEKGIITFLPCITRVKQWSDRRKKISEPLFRGYVFVKVDLHYEKLSVLQTDGVVKFVGIRNAPSVIPENQITWLNIITKNGNNVSVVSPISVGEKVKVIHGPFKGLIGNVVELRNSSRLIMVLDALSQAISIEINPQYLKKFN